MSTDLRSIGFSEIRERIAGNRLAVLEALKAHGPATSSELARAMGWTVLQVRPRLTEISAMYHAKTTGERRDSEHVYVALSASDAFRAHEAARNELEASTWRPACVDGTQALLFG